MANVNYLNCTTDTPYTGVAKCNIPFGMLQGMIFVPKGTKYTLAQLATLSTTLATAAQQVGPTTRVYPVGPFIGFTDTSTDTVLETTDYGYSAVVRDGTFVWKGRTGFGGDCLYKGLRKFHNKQDLYDVIYIFKKGMLLTYQPNVTTGALEVKGVAVSLINVPIFKLAVGTTAEQYMIETQIFDATQIADDSIFVQTDTSALNVVQGISGVDIQNAAVFNTSPAGAVDVLPVVSCDGSSLVTTYGSTWASASLWVATNALTGAVITITGVSIVLGKYRIQLDTTDTDYPASGAKVVITGASVATLYAAGIIGYETNSVSIARP